MACQYNTSTFKGLSEYRNSNMDCQNTVVEVGDCVAELRPYIYPRKVIYNDFLGSAIISLFCFCLDGRARERTCAHSSRWLVHHKRWFLTSSSLAINFCIIHCSQAFLGRKRHFKHQPTSSSCAFTRLLRVNFIATSASL